MKNRWFLILAVLLTLGLVLAACSPAAQAPVEEAPAEEEAAPAEEEAAPAEEEAAPAEEEAPAEEAPAEEAPAEEAMGEGSIWVLLPDSASSARWETDDRRFFEQAFEAAGVEYSIVNAEGDSRTQQTQAEQAITAGAKVILLVNLDSGSGAAIIAAARDAGVAVVDYDRLTVEGPGADVYVSFDNVQVGATMAEVVEPLCSEKDTPNVVLLNGGPTDNNSTLFREGYFAAAEPHFNDGSWNLVDDQWVPDWDNQQALVIFEQILTAAEGEVDCVFAANDGLANAVISAFQAAGIDPGDAGIPISGQDATVGGIQHVLAGDQAMSVYKPIKAEAEAAAEAAIALFNGEDVAALAGGKMINNGTNDLPFVALTPVAVTKDNVAETVIADGFRTWEELCVGDFAQFCPEEFGGAAPAEEAAAPVETAVSLTVWADDKRLPVLETLADEFAATAGVGLVLEQVQIQDMLEQTRVAIPAGEGPDIFIVPHDQIGQLVEGGLIAPIDLGAKADSIAPAALQAFNYNSELYALPYATENVALIRNTDLVPEPVETWDEMLEVGAALQDAGTVENVTVIPSQYASHGMHTAFGGYLFGQDADGNYLPDDVGLDSPGFVAFGEWLQQAASDGYISTTIDYATANALFAEGKIPFIINGPWAMGEYKDAGVNYAVDPLPTGPEAPGAPFLGAQGFVINAQGENQLLAQTFLTELVATDEIMAAFQAEDPRIPAWLPTLEIVEDPDLAAFGVAGQAAQPMPAIPAMGSVWGSWQDSLQLIVNGEDVTETLTNGANQIRDAIAGGS